MLITRGSFIPTPITIGHDTSFLLFDHPPLPKEYTTGTIGCFPLYPLPILYDNLYSDHTILLSPPPRTLLDRTHKWRKSCPSERLTLHLRKYLKMGQPVVYPGRGDLDITSYPSGRESRKGMGR